MSTRDGVLFGTRREIDAAQEANFAQMMDLVCERHPYYRRLLASRGLSRSEFASLADLAKLPVTRKEEYVREPEAFVLDDAGLPEEMRAVWDVMHTTGSTSGKPTPFVSTAFDFYRILELQRNMMRLRRVRSEDIVANLFPLTVYPHGAFIRALHASAAVNLRVVCALPGNPSPYFTLGSETDEVVRIVERSRASILWGVPSYVRRVLARAEELGADFRSVRLAFVTGEGLPEAAREDLTSALRRVGAADAWVSISYGSTETQGGLVECAPGSGYHNPAPDQFHVSIVDPDSNEPVDDGKPGMVVVTHLKRRGTVLLRYALGDVSVRTRERCPHCGSHTERLTEMPRRADALVKIKGMLVNPDIMVREAQQALSGREFQFVIGKENASEPLSPDIVTLKVAGPADAALGARLAARIKAVVGVTPALEFVTPEALADPSGGWKLKRVVDDRSGAGDSSTNGGIAA